MLLSRLGVQQISNQIDLKFLDVIFKAINCYLVMKLFVYYSLKI